MGKTKPLYVDLVRKRTAADIESVQECEALIKVTEQAVKKMEALGTPTLRSKTALHFRRKALMALADRKAKLILPSA